MFHGLSYQPNHYVAVKHHIFEVEFLFEFIFVDEGGFEFPFSFGTELLDLDLLGENHSVL